MNLKYLFWTFLFILFSVFFIFPYLLGYEEIQNKKVYDKQQQEYYAKQHLRVIQEISPQELQNNLLKWNDIKFIPARNNSEKPRFFELSKGNYGKLEEARIDFSMQTTLTQPEELLEFSFGIRSAKEPSDFHTLQIIYFNILDQIPFSNSERVLLKEWLEQCFLDKKPHSTYTIMNLQFHYVRYDPKQTDPKHSLYFTLHKMP